MTRREVVPNPEVPPAPLGGFLVGAVSVLALGAIWTFYLGWLVAPPFGVYWSPYVAITVVVIVLGLRARTPKQRARIAIGALAGWLMTLLYLLIAVVHI